MNYQPDEEIKLNMKQKQIKPVRSFLLEVQDNFPYVKIAIKFEKLVISKP
jgi:hypothetical protein